jgi:hypothetical protein
MTLRSRLRLTAPVQAGRRRLTRWLASSAAVLCVVGATTGAAAQDMFDRETNVGVLDRPHPEYQALGLRYGAWSAYPKITVETLYDDNIYATQNGAVSDAVFNIVPQISIQSDWGRNALSLTAQSVLTAYAAHSHEDSAQFQVTGEGTLDADSSLELKAKFQYGLTTLARSSANYTVETISPLQYYAALGQVELTKEFARFKVDLLASDEHDTYTSADIPGGGTLREAYLDHNQLSFKERLDYAVNPSLAFFAEQTNSLAYYDSSASRNSANYALILGADFQLTHLITARIGGGYIFSTYNSHDVSSFGGPDGYVRLQWFPTQLITVTLSDTEGVFDSGIANSPSELSQDLRLEANYELLRNLIVSGALEGHWLSYQGIHREDNVYAEQLGAVWLMNRHVGVALRVTHQSQSSTGPAHGRSFDDNQVGLALTFQQ